MEREREREREREKKNACQTNNKKCEGSQRMLSPSENHWWHPSSTVLKLIGIDTWHAGHT